MIDGKLMGLEQLKRDFEILRLSPDKKTKILKETMKDIRKNMIRNKNQQKEPSGKNWKPRAKPKTETTKSGKIKDSKMLKRIHSGSRTSANAEQGKFDYKNAVSERIAGEHQYGATLSPTLGNTGKTREKDNGVSSQAKAELLLKLGFNEPATPRGYKPRRGKGRLSGRQVIGLWALRILSGKNRRSSSVKYIQENLTDGQVGALISELRKRKGLNNKKGKLELPARGFLDEDEKRNTERMTKQVDKIITDKL